MKTPKIPTLALSAIALAIFTVPTYAQSVFNGSVSDDYGTAANWTPSGVPTTGSGATAIINNGDAVTYSGAESGDLVLANGGTLEVTNGSWTQTVNNNYIQLGQGGGNGNILVNGGVFNQGTASSTPFNIEGTGNTFTISSGTANFDSSFSASAGLTYLQTGGVVNTTGEFDANSTTASMSGGVLNTTLLTTVNGPVGATFNLSGGTINLSDGTGIYGGNANQINFTVTSSGIINFLDTSTSTVQGMVNAGIISYEDAADPSAITVTADGPDGASAFLTIPEPSSYALIGLGSLGMFFILRRKKAGLIS